MEHNKILKTILAAFFLALSYIMPFMTGQVPEIGAQLCPMHIPVLLCGFICGWKWGLIVGFVAPLLRSFILGMPPLFPTAFCMAFELSAYGLVAGVLHNKFPKINIYISLLISMIAGRIMWGIVMFLCVGITGTFTLEAFIAGAVTNAIPGIIVQIIVIPVIVIVTEKIKPIKE